MAPLTDIIIPVYKQSEVTEQCLESVMRYTYDYGLIIIDNGLEKPTRKILESLQVFSNPQIRVIRNEENLGFVKAINQGMKISMAPYVCLLNNDTVVTANWLDYMVTTMKEHEKDRCGFVTPNSSYHHNPWMRQIIDSLPKPMDIQLPIILGFCLLINRDLISEIGLLDERFAEGYGYDETDYYRRAQEKGWTAWLSHRAYVYHRALTSFNALYSKPKLKALYERNRQLFNQKWGVKNG